MNAGWGLWPRISWNPPDFTLKSSGFHLWNLADFTQISQVKSTQNYKSRCFSKNSLVWWMQGGGFNPRNPVDFTLKSSGFHPWNLVDFTQISPVKSTQNYKSKCFSKNSSVWWMQGGGYDQGFNEIHQISPWNPVDFTCEIWQISPRYHRWNPPKIIKAGVSAKTLQFDECRVGDLTLEIWWISPWNPVDFTHEIWWISPRYHLWNPPKIIKASVSAKTLQFDECRVGAMTKDFTHEIWWISPRFHLWNPPKIIKASVSAKTLQFDECRVGAMTKDFIHEIWWISPRFHLWNPPQIIKASVSAKTLQFDECRVGAMTKDFMKSAWNLPDFMNYELLCDDQV